MSNIDEDRVISEIRGDAEESFDDVSFLVRFHLNTVSTQARAACHHAWTIGETWAKLSAAPRHYITYVLTSNSGSLVDGVWRRCSISYQRDTTNRELVPLAYSYLSCLRCLF
jgi:hypothetical protein